jgi:hypothetical protein
MSHTPSDDEGLRAAIQVWFDTEIGHGHCPSDETDENCKCNQLMALISQKITEARVDELKRISKLTIEKPATPENKENQTWQGGYRFARNSLKRYKLDRIATLTTKQDTKEDK